MHITSVEQIDKEKILHDLQTQKHKNPTPSKSSRFATKPTNTKKKGSLTSLASQIITVARSACNMAQ